MPQPPILSQIDWKKVFDSGVSYESWLANIKKSERRDALIEDLSLQGIPTVKQAALKAIPRKVHVVSIAEDWCGDVLRHVPVLQRLAGFSSNIEIKYISREQHKDVFIRFLTNGGEAIPKFIFLSEDFVECGNWGPMQENCRQLISRGKACNDVGTARKKVSALYAADPEKHQVINELFDLITLASAESV